MPLSCGYDGRVDFRQLRAFLAVSEELSFSRAAERSFISQSAVSHQIAALEKDLGTSLFDRSTRSVALTEAGARLVPIAQQVLGLETSAYRLARGPRNRVRVAVGRGLAPAVAGAMTALRRTDPLLEVEAVALPFVDRVEAVVDGEVDVALIRGTTDRAGITTSELGNEDLVIATAAEHPMAAFTRVDLGELAPYPLLLPPRTQQVLLHTVISTAFAEAGRRYRLGPPVHHGHVSLLDIVTGPRSWTVVYPGQAAQFAGRGVHFMRDEQQRLRVPLTAVLRAGTNAPAVVEVVRALEAVVSATKPDS